MKKIKVFIAILIFSFFFIIGFNVKASEYLSDKSETIYNSSNGLLTGKANTICQTEDGYIWIGQYAGLTKYDSKEFYTMTSYGENNLTAIVTLASKGNNLFIGSEKGFFIKDENDVISQIQTGDQNLVVKDIQVVDDYAYVGTDNGLYRYEISTKSLVRLKSVSVSRIAIVDKDNYYYLVGRDKVYSSNFESPIIENNVKSIYYKNNILYIGTRRGELIIKNITSGDETLYQPAGLSQTINDILIRDNTMYLSSDAGLYIGNATTLDIKKAKSYGDEFHKMEKAFFDYEKNLWLASSSQGVYKISQNELFDLFFEYGLKEKTTYAIEKYHNLTFIGTEEGLYVIDQINDIRIDASEYEDISLEPNKIVRDISILYNSIGNNPVRDIEIYNDKIYFALEKSNGLIYYDYNENDSISSVGIILYDDITNNLYSSSSSKDLKSLKTVGNYLFIGLDKGIARYDGTNTIFRETEVLPLYFTNDGDDLYVVFNTIGVVKTSVSNFETATIERIDKDNKYSTLKCFLVKDGILFTDNNELYFKDDDGVKKIETNFIGSIVDISFINNKYFIASEVNVYIIDDIFDSNSSREVIDSTNGLKTSLVANSSGYYDESDNDYYFVTTEGIVLYNLDVSIEDSTIRRKIAINYIIADEKNKTGNKIVLKSDTKTLKIDFSVLSFSSNQHYTVYYKLKGYDNNYQIKRPTDSFDITYKNLSGGKYEFELYTMDSNGLRSENKIIIQIVKKKAVTEQWWFYLIIIVLASVVIAGINIAYIKYKTKKSIARQNEYKAITIESIQAIARTIDAKDEYTNGHSFRVGQYAKIIASKLGLREEEVDNIYYVALLHDIGKIGIPLEILNKPGKLTDEEYAVMKTHPSKGAKILEGITTIPNIVAGAKYHHERYDGRGYPEGLSGENIPYIARIIACCDCFDAMATRRSYKEPYTKEKIIEEFEKARGTQLDPNIVDVVIELIKTGKLEINNLVDKNLKINKD